MSNHALIMPFLDESPAFAHGVEFGMLYVRMRDGTEDVIGDLFLIDNQDQILLAANRMGWRVTKITPAVEGWFFCRLERSVT